MPQEPPATGEPASNPETQPYIFITGAASGIGRAFFNHFTDPATRARSSSSSTLPPLPVLGVDVQPWTDAATGATHDVFRPPASGSSAPPGSVFARLDVTAPVDDQRAFLLRHVLLPPGFAASTTTTTPPIALVLHCAGVRGLAPRVPVAASADVAAAETLGATDAATLLRTFEVNVVGAFNVLSAVLPNLRLAAAAGAAGAGTGGGGGVVGTGGSSSSSRWAGRPRVVVLSSRMGSIGGNRAGGGYAYRASKAALNAVLTSMAVDVPEVFFAMVHPGRVETGLVSVREDGAIRPEESLEDLLALFERFDVEGGLSSGCFVDRFGETIPW